MFILTSFVHWISKIKDSELVCGFKTSRDTSLISSVEVSFIRLNLRKRHVMMILRDILTRVWLNGDYVNSLSTPEPLYSDDCERLQIDERNFRGQISIYFSVD